MDTMEWALDSDLQFDPILVIIGLFVGVSVGLTGIGAGSLLTPILLLLGVRPVDAVGASLVNSLVMKSVGAAQHDRQGTLSRPLLRALLAGAIPGALGGSLAVVYFAWRAPGATELFLKVAIGIALALSAILLLRQILADRRERKRPKSVLEEGAEVPDGQPLDAGPLPRRLALLTVGVGALTGVVVSVTSIGSGSFLLPFLVFVFAQRIRLHRIVGADVAAGAAIGLVATLVYIISGTVQAGPLLWLLLGSVPGVMIGSRTNFRLNLNGARAAVSSVTLCVAVIMVAGVAVGV
jgi:hypothetical protein